MGESREGEGGGHEVTDSDIFASILQAFEDEGREPSDVRFVRLSDGFYRLDVTIHGESEPDGIYLWTQGEVSALHTRTAIGGTSPAREE
jgi:hypothetical protein